MESLLRNEQVGLRRGSDPKGGSSKSGIKPGGSFNFLGRLGNARRTHHTSAMHPETPTPFLTAELPGIGGTLKQCPDDFIVEEVPAYQPCGEGEHLFLWIEKTDVAADDLLRHVARALGISPRDVGTAGVKDRRAVTRQFVSVPAKCAADVHRIETDRIHVLRHIRHANKLRTGHLRGNQFSILIREVDADAAKKAGAIAAAISRLGFPNYYGEQRFGREQETLRIGFELLRGTRRPRSIPFSQRRFLLRMSLSAVQSALFNAVLGERLRDGLFATVLAGDVMEVAASGGQFVATDTVAEQQRFDSRETVLTGPIFGPRMTAPQHEPAEREGRILSAWELTPEDFTRFAKLTSGTRRPLVVWPDELRLEQQSEGLRVDFRLPGGAYATTLLREFMKIP
jgi:tRNA pseudouridine13 synthase